jgi:hypothetical protein
MITLDVAKQRRGGKPLSAKLRLAFATADLRHAAQILIATRNPVGDNAAN